MENGWQAGQGTRWGWMKMDGRPMGGWIGGCGWDRDGKMDKVDKGWARMDGGRAGGCFTQWSGSRATATGSGIQTPS